MNEARYREAEQRLWSSVGLNPTERQVHLPHLGTSIRIQEVGDGPVIVFVHGGSAGGANWAPLAARLGGFRCVLIDRPGCGLSDPTDKDLSDLDSFAAFADVLVADVVDALELPPALVVATSLGGHFALRGAAAHPSRFERMVEFGYVPGAPMAHVPISMRAATLPGLRRVMTTIPPTPSAIRIIMRQLGLGPAMKDGRISQAMLDWFRSLLRDTHTMRNDTNSPREILQIRPKREVLPASVLSEVRCPVHFIWGENDPFGGADVAEPFVRKIGDAELELWPDASHAPWFDDADAAAARIVEFFT